MTLTANNQPSLAYTLAVAAVLMLAGSTVGCTRSQPKTTQNTSNQTASASPSPSPTPTPQKKVYAQADDIEVTMTNVKGQTVAVVKAKTTNYDPLSGSAALIGRDADAVLYEDGKPATRLRAEKVQTDKDTRIITATGNVRVESLSLKDAPTVRADRMVWKADSKVLTGDGKVLMTAEPEFQMPGSTFRADTKLNKVLVQQDDRLGQGSL